MLPPVLPPADLPPFITFSPKAIKAFLDFFNNALAELQMSVTANTPFMNKLVLDADGTNISVECTPLVDFNLGPTAKTAVGYKGNGTTDKKGHGEFENTWSLPMWLVGPFKLRVEGTVVSLLDSGGENVIWFGNGSQEGLDGVYDIEL